MAEQPQYPIPEQNSTPFENGDVLEFHAATSEHLRPYGELEEARRATQEALGGLATSPERTMSIVEQARDYLLAVGSNLQTSRQYKLDTNWNVEDRDVA